MVTDFLIRIKNASMAKNKLVQSRMNKFDLSVAEALKKLGFLDEVKKEGNVIKASLAFKNKRPVLRNVKLISKSGLRIYMDVKEIEKHKKPSVYLISSAQGIISSRQAKKLRIGGEVIAEIS